MAATNSQKQLLNLIRDFAVEKSQGERRVSNLKKRIDELQREFEAANADLENSKSLKETIEQEIKGYEVEASISEASIQALEARIASVQDEISKVGSDIDALKNQESVQRDEFISQMLELKSKIRKFQDSVLLNSPENGCLGTSSAEHSHTGNKYLDSVDVEKTLCIIVDQIAAEEKECERQQYLHDQLHQELIDYKRKQELMEKLIKEMKELQDLTKLTNELEEKCASFTKELQGRCICPNCHLDSPEVLVAVLQQMADQ